MTCIIAHRDGWMCADRRTTFTGGLLGPYVLSKVKRSDGLLWATAGAGVLPTKIKAVLKDDDRYYPANLKAIQGLFLAQPGDGMQGHALVLTVDRRIYELSSSGELSEIGRKVTHWSIGSGYQFALGYLHAIEKTRKITPKDARAAIAFASTRVNDVGDGFQLEKL